MPITENQRQGIKIVVDNVCNDILKILPNPEGDDLIQRIYLGKDFDFQEFIRGYGKKNPTWRTAYQKECLVLAEDLANLCWARLGASHSLAEKLDKANALDLKSGEDKYDAVKRYINNDPKARVDGTFLAYSKDVIREHLKLPKQEVVKGGITTEGATKEKETIVASTDMAANLYKIKLDRMGRDESGFFTKIFTAINAGDSTTALTELDHFEKFMKPTQREQHMVLVLNEMNERGERMINLAKSKKMDGVVDKLIAMGANPNLKDKLVGAKTTTTTTLPTPPQTTTTTTLPTPPKTTTTTTSPTPPPAVFGGSTTTTIKTTTLTQGVPTEEMFSLLAQLRDADALKLIQSVPNLDITIQHPGDNKTLLDFAKTYGCHNTAAHLLKMHLEEPSETMFSLLANRNDAAASELIKQHPFVNLEAKHVGDQKTLLMYAQTYGCRKTEEVLMQIKNKQQP